MWAHETELLAVFGIESLNDLVKRNWSMMRIYVVILSASYGEVVFLAL